MAHFVRAWFGRCEPQKPRQRFLRRAAPEPREPKCATFLARHERLIFPPFTEMDQFSLSRQTRKFWPTDAKILANRREKWPTDAKNATFRVRSHFSQLDAKSATFRVSSQSQNRHENWYISVLGGKRPKNRLRERTAKRQGNGCRGRSRPPAE